MGWKTTSGTSSNTDFLGEFSYPQKENVLKKNAFFRIFEFVRKMRPNKNPDYNTNF